MNIPGEASGQWRFRLTDEAMHKLDLTWIRHNNKLYERFNRVVLLREEEQLTRILEAEVVPNLLKDSPV